MVKQKWAMCMANSAMLANCALWNYIKIVKDTINEVLSLHVKETNGGLKNNNNNNNSNGSMNNNNNSNYHNKEFIIYDQLLLETILMMIRGETIKYSSYRKKSIMKKKNSWKKI